MERITTKTTTKSSVKELTRNGMMIALTLLFTAFINIRLPFMGNGGLIHLGNVPLFLGAIFLAKRRDFWQVHLEWGCLTCYPAGRHGHHLRLSLLV